MVFDLAGSSSAGASFRLRRLVAVGSCKVSAGDERFIVVFHDAKERRSVAEHLVVVETRLVLEEAENLSPVLQGFLLKKPRICRLFSWEL